MAYEFVTKKEVAIAKKEIEQVIKKVHNYLERNLTFEHRLVGSAGNSRHLVTRIINGNKSFDMDYNLVLQKHFENISPKKIRLMFMDAFNKFKPKNFKFCEDSTSVFTLKKVDTNTKKIIYSVDFAIVYYFEEPIPNPNFDDDYDDPDEEYFYIERQKLIKFNDQKNTYAWELRKIATDHREIEQLIKENGLWSQLRDLYLKNKNHYPTEKSRIIYYNSLNQIYQTNF